MQTIILSGASSGIGRELAKIYRAQGAQLVLLLRQSPPDAAPGEFPPAECCYCDLREPTTAAMAVRAHLEQRAIGKIDLLIHCAAVGQYGPVSALQPNQLDEVLAVNLYSPLHVSQILLPWLEAGRGRVVLIGSVVSGLAAPRYAVYAASKAALDGAARALRSEWRGRIAVQVIRPGATRTAMHARSGISLAELPYDRFPPAAQTAAKIAKAIATSSADRVIGLGNALAWLVGRGMPSLLDALMARTATRRGGQ